MGQLASPSWFAVSSLDETPWTDDGPLADANMDVGSMDLVLELGLELGVGLRSRLTAGFAVHLELAYMLRSWSPVWTAPNGDELTLLSGSHSRIGAGLTWMW